MPAKKDPRIDAYIAQSAAFARPILQHLRQLVHQGNPAVEETIKWSCPFFLYEGKLFCSFAAFKAHAAFGFHHQGMDRVLSKEIGKTTEAMGLMGRLTTLKDLPDKTTLLRYIRLAKALQDAGQPRITKAKPKPALSVPADLADALKRSQKAAAAWAGFSPSCRREYIEWITGAKRPETRESRLLTTIEWVAEGKSRHWKYQNC